MNELRPQLDRARRAAPPAPPDLDRLHRRRERKERVGRLGTVTLALVIGFAAIGGAWFAFRGTGDVTGSLGAGGGRAAGGALTGPTADLTMRPGDFYYVRSRSYAHLESWWTTDASGRIRTLDDPHPDPRLDRSYGAGEFFSDSGPVADLSTDPGELEAQLRVRVEPGGASPEPYAEWGGPVEWGLIRSIGELLEASDVTPAQKAALFEVAAGLDGVEIAEGSTDPAGRPAILLTTTTEGELHRWWFDPSSYQVLSLGTGYVVERAGFAPSTDAADLRLALVSPGG